MLRNLNVSAVAGKRILGTPRVGVLGAAIPVDSYIYPSLDLPGDATKFYRGQVVTWPAQGALTPYENGSYEYDPAGAVGQQSFTVQIYENNVALGSPITWTIDVVSNATIASVTISPKTVTVSGNAQHQFSKTVTGTNNPPTDVTWSVTSGQINSATGLFTAPAGTASVQTITVTAVSNFDGTKSDTAIVTVPAVAFTQYPSESDVRLGIRYGASGEYTGTLIGEGGILISINGIGITTQGGLALPLG